MKKVLTLLALMAIVMGMAFADVYVSGTAPTGSEKAEIEVVLDLSSNDLAKAFTIGFSTVDVTTYGQEIPTATQITLDENTADGEVANSTAVYVYWIVKGQKVDVKMQATEKLTSDSDSTGIDWSVSAPLNGTGADVESSTVGGTTSNTVTVATVDATSKLMVDSTPLTVSTENLLTTDTTQQESYSGTLALTISVVN